MGSKQSKSGTGKEIKFLQHARCRQLHSSQSVPVSLVDKSNTDDFHPLVTNDEVDVVGNCLDITTANAIIPDDEIEVISSVSQQLEEDTGENQGDQENSQVVILDGDLPEIDNDCTNVLPVQCIPPEVWEQVFGYLNDYRDCVSVSNVCPYWKNVLSSSRQCWLFTMIFPYLLDYLSKNEILRCRLICKFWHAGVNHFFENNCYHRPALKLVTRQVNGTDEIVNFTDLRLQQLETALRTKKLAYVNLYESEKMNDILLETTRLSSLPGIQPSCPFVGRSVDMLESYRAPLPPPNLLFLQRLGHHLWFLRLVIENFPPAETLTRIFQLIVHVPNLKKLKIIAIIVPPRTPAQVVSPSFLETLTVNREEVPKLETFDLTILPTRDAKMVEVLLNYFGGNSLQTLSLNVTPTISNWTSMEMKNLTYLSLSLDTNSRLKSLLYLKSPLQRLSVRLHGRVKATILFEVVHHFRSSLRNLSFNFSLDFFTGNSLPCINLPVQLLPFSNSNSFEGEYPHLKRAFLSSCRPISCNFLCGLTTTLQYLHIFLEEVGHWNKFQYKAEGFPVQEWIERLDLLEYLKKLSNSNRSELYRSNVWKVFPRLKVLTVQVFRNIKGNAMDRKKETEWEFRRNVYDLLQLEESKLL